MAQDYKKEWSEIETLENNGLPESALKQTEALLTQIRQDVNNKKQVVLLIKGMIYLNKFQSRLEENGLEKALYRFQTEMEKEKGIIKSIMQSMLAEMYHEYLNNYLYKFKDRTTVVDYNPADISSWDIRGITNKIFELYTASVQNEEIKKIKLTDFEDILTNRNFNADLRPTLYDFLINRAIYFFTNDNAYLTQPAYKFYIDEPNTLADATTFVNHKFTAKDSISNKFRCLLMYQDWIRFHMNDQDTTALMEADLRRLEWVYSQTIIGEKDSLYLNSLNGIAKKYEKHLSAAEALFMIGNWHLTQGNKYQPSPEQLYRWELKKAKEIFEKVIANYSGKSFGVQNAKSALSNILAKEMDLKINEVNPSNKPILASLSYQNLKNIHLKLIKVSEAEANKLANMLYEKDKAVSFINNLKTIKSWSEQLPDEADFQNHRVELKIPALDYGLYILVTSEKSNFEYYENGINYTLFNVSDLAYFSRNNDGITEFFVTDRSSGKPKPAVKAEFYVFRYNSFTREYDEKKIGQAVSDHNGFVKSPYNELENISYYVKLTYGKDVLHKKSRYYNYKKNQVDYPKETTHLFLDRAIYRPGQTVYFKGIIIRTENDKPRIFPGFETEINFMDANGQLVAKQRVISNEYGSYNGSFTAPASGLTGQMYLADYSTNSYKYFRVEEYKRPKFEVSFPPIDASFRLNDTVKIKGIVKAFAGSTIDGAKVQYRVVRKVNFPYWRWWYRGWNPFEREAQEIAFGEMKSNEKGEFEIIFKAIPDLSIPENQKPQFSYEITADVTDITGETHSKSTTVIVGYLALNADIITGENVVKESTKHFKISTKNLNGEFEEAKGNITIELLKTPNTTYVDKGWNQPDYFLMKEADFKRDFPHYAYNNEDKIYNWPIDKKVLEVDFNSKVSDSLFLTGIETWAQGIYKITMLTSDKFGNKIEEIKFFTLVSEKENTTPVNNKLFLSKNNIIAEPGEKITIDFGSFEKDAHVLYVVEHEGKLISSQWVHAKGRKTFELAVEEKHRGNFFFHLSMVHHGKFISNTGTITVPWTNKELEIEYSTFRDKLEPGQEEEWRLKITGSKKDKVAAELLSTLYDASLDAFAANSWDLNLYGYNYPSLTPTASVGFITTNSITVPTINWNKTYVNLNQRIYPELHWFGFDFYDWGWDRSFYLDGVAVTEPRVLSEASVEEEKGSKRKETGKFRSNLRQQDEDKLEIMSKAEESTILTDSTGNSSEDIPNKQATGDFGDVKVRTNLKETVFFFPQMETDADGNILLKFKMNEALTRWKFMWLAHTKDLKIGTGTKEIITQKKLMVMPNAPRFFRENDEIYFTAKVSNMTESEMIGEAVLQLFDAITMKAIDVEFSNSDARLNFTAAAGQSAPLTWKLKIPDSWSNPVTYRVIAKSGTFSDGEENSLPVISNRMLVTETMPLPIRGGQIKTFEFKRMSEISKSSTLKQHKFTLEFTPNPAWLAIQSLPYIMEYPYDCTEQIFSRFYANSIATNVANAHPKIKKVFDSWKNYQPDALKSNLSKNQELKYALLEETPWVLESQSEEQQKNNLGILFDLNRMSNELNTAKDKIVERQLSNGGFSWFPGGRDSWYITQYIVEGMGHLEKLGVSVSKSDEKMSQSIKKAVLYIDDRLSDHYNELLKLAKRSKEGEKAFLEKDNLDQMAIHYLYTRSFYPEIEINNNNTKIAVEYYEKQAAKYVLKKSDYMQSMLALALNRKGNDLATAQKIVKSLKERALKNEEMGMYWQYPHGFYWYEMPIETHALMIEVFDEVAKDKNAVDDMKTYLLKSKQTTNWGTTKSTASACYALLKTGDNWLMEDQEIKITLGKEVLDQSKISKEAGTGYFKTSFDAEQIKKEWSKVKIENPNKNVAWGAVYWQYFEQLDKISQFRDTPLKISKKLFKEVRTERGPELQPISEDTKLSPGDLIKVRIELKVDRDMEFVHMKDMRASGFEPVNVLSAYKYQGGLGYYESSRDASTNFFFDNLSKGNYVFEYPLRVNHKGDFSNGITTIQCMYAPEFTSHSQGERVKID